MATSTVAGTATSGSGLTRRRLLGGLGVLPAMPFGRGLAQSAAGGEPRRLKLYNIHTGEHFDGEYHDGRRYLLDALAALDWFLRDHHADATAIMDMDVLDEDPAVPAHGVGGTLTAVEGENNDTVLVTFAQNMSPWKLLTWRSTRSPRPAVARSSI